MLCGRRGRPGHMKRGFEAEPAGEPQSKKGNFRPVGAVPYAPQGAAVPVAQPRPPVPTGPAPAAVTVPVTTPSYRLTHNPQAAAAAASGQPYRQLKVEDALNYLDKVGARVPVATGGRV